ncbi:trypsin, alkaline B-like [Aricia agestis]|uniref:trypsin, alkaline B-like n=1 Tax=Aricia agestis TaxID=91739 RepID=UPI001C204A1A|nr:trypsin, alkaline B-like [Aricia agestis]
MKFFIIFGLAVACFSVSNGSPTSRIAGGVVTDIRNYPFATSLISNIGSTSFTQACAGTIISSSAILSAASCFFTGNQAHSIESWRARVGSTYSNSQGLIYLIRRITTHPDFVSTTLVNDVAVLRTVVQITFTDTVQPAYLAGGAYNLANNQQVWGIGWGVTSNVAAPSPNLRDVQVFVIDQQTCINRYNEIGFAVNDNMLCAGWLDVGVRGQCEGDNGGPLLHNGVVVGVYSWTEGCGTGRHPSINTRVSAFIRWIESTAVAA